MSKVAFLFPGQGSQSVGMGVSLVERFPEVRSVFAQASDLLHWDLLQACREGPDDRLRQTDIAQPALYVTGYAAALVLKSMGIAPAGVAGHSIGEYAALAVANAFSFSEGLMLVQERGRLMAQSGQSHPGSMAAILGLDAEQVTQFCRQAQEKGVCAAVNFNSPEQIVIAGEIAALEEAGRLAEAAGAKRVISLNVSGAFHSPLMQEAATAMRERIQKIRFQSASIPVAMNVDGQLHQEAADIQTQLTLQLDHPVQWVKSMQSLAAGGYTIYVESGSGRVLTGLLRRINKQLQGYSTDSVEAVFQVKEFLEATPHPHPLPQGEREKKRQAPL